MNKVTSPRVRVLLAFLLILQITATAFSGISFVPGQGVVLTGADGVVLTGADGVVLTGADGVVLTGADGVVLTGADGVVLTGADVNTFTRPYGVVLTGADSTLGIRSLDPELALIMDRLPDTSAINVFVVYHRMPTSSDINALRAAGILGGTKFRNLPMVIVNATKRQIAAISTQPSVRTIYSNKTLEFLTHDTRVVTGQDQTMADSVLTQRNGGMPLSGQGVTVAILDTGIDATHPDLPLGTKVVQNARVLDLMGLPLGFWYPTVLEGLPNSDPLMGHGTFVAGVVAGTGAASGGYYGGMAPGAKLLGVSCGDASLFYVLSGMDYILSNRVAQNIRVVNCSFGVSGLFDANDPVNIASKIMHDAGISVVFSAGNRGSQPNSLNPYSVAPWVIGVGASKKSGSLSSFSSRGQGSYGLFHPTLVAPGEAIVSARALGVSLIGVAGLAGLDASGLNDLQAIPPAYLLSYTMSSGTSFAAPHVAGTIALMLQANPQLTPDQIKLILQETATPMLGYTRYEVGAGHLNTYAAVRKAAFNTSFGRFRYLLNESVVRLTQEAVTQFSGILAPSSSYSTHIEIPQDTIFATVQVGWVKRNGIGFANSLNVSLQKHGEFYQSNPVTVLLAGNQMWRTGVIVNEPTVGDWTITVNNTSNSLTGGTQHFICSIEIIRANYDAVANINLVPEEERLALKRALRSGLINLGSAESATSEATRLEVARAVALSGGARVPLYLPYSPTFADLPADGSAVFVESLARSQGENILGATGTQFNPQAATDRLAVAVAAVKMLGLQQEAQSSTLAVGEVTDRDAIPEAMRGFVAVAIRRNLMSLDETGSFRPFAPIKRGELARTSVALQQATR